MKKINSIIFCIFISLFFVQSCSKHRSAPVKDLSKSQQKTKVQRVTSTNKSYFKVRKGDTLYSIGFANNIDYKKLAKINNIKPPYRIYPGQKLKLKGKVLPKKKTVKTNQKKTKTYPIKKKTIVSSKTSKANNQKIVKNTPPTKNKPSPVKKKPKISKNPPVISQPTSSNSQWIWPVKGKILSSFSSTDTSRKGIKIAVGFGKPVYASNNGTVVYSGHGLRGYGELIIIKHSNNLLSAYAHNSVRYVKEGQSVKQGQEIAKSGKGNDGKPLLHFEIRKNGQPVNPINYLPK